MKNTKTDNRSKFTQGIIKNALIKLMSGQPLNKVTVSQLCAAASVNRGTFYNHFYDIYDVYDSIESDLKNEVVEKLSRTKAYDYKNPFFREIMFMLYRNIDLVRIILLNKNDSSFLNQIISYVLDKYIKELPELYGGTPEKIAQICSYIVNGSLGIISDWVMGGLKQPLDEIAAFVENLNKLIINTLPKK